MPPPSHPFSGLYIYMRKRRYLYIYTYRYMYVCICVSLCHPSHPIPRLYDYTQPQTKPVFNRKSHQPLSNICAQQKSIKNRHAALKMSFSNIMSGYSGILPLDLEMKCSSISLWCGKENNSMTRRVVERSWVVDVFIVKCCEEEHNLTNSGILYGVAKTQRIPYLYR